MGYSYNNVVFPLATELQAGDFVRVTHVNRVPRYQTGDKGMIVMGPNGLMDRLYYLVMMHKDEPSRVVIFAEDEIELDY